MSENLAERKRPIKTKHCHTHNLDYLVCVRYCPECLKWQINYNRKEYLKELDVPTRFVDATLENYLVENEKQTQIVKDIHFFLESLSKKLNTGLIMIGKTGTGKTHLCYGIMKKFIKKYPMTGCPKMIKCAELIRLFKANWQTKQTTEQRIIDDFSNYKFLIINEIGIQFNSEMEKQYLTEIVDNRYERMYPTILVGNITMPEITISIGDRIIDRFRQDGKVLAFDWESYRGKS